MIHIIFIFIAEAYAIVHYIYVNKTYASNMWSSVFVIGTGWWIIQRHEPDMHNNSFPIPQYPSHAI